MSSPSSPSPAPRAAWPVRLFRRLDGSLRARVLLPTVLFFALTLAAMVAASVVLYGGAVERAQRDRIEVYSRVLTAGLANLVDAGQLGQTSRFLEVGTLHRRDVELINVLSADGRVLFSSHAAYVGSLSWPDVREVQGPTYRRLGPDSGAMLSPLPVASACTSCHGRPDETVAWLELRYDDRGVARARTTLAQTLAASTTPALVLLIGIAYWLLGREAIHPLQRIVGVMRRAEAGDLTVRADEGRPDELGEAARRFDLTLAALHRSREELERAYQASMVRADRLASIGQLATGLAHEIKNPLAGCSTALELLQEDLVGSPRQSEVVAEMRHQLDRVAKTMEGMLSFARPPRATLRRTDVNATLGSIVFLLDRHRGKAKVTVVPELAADLPAAFTDPSLLEQVFLNLGLNAVQAMGETGGTLTIRSGVDDGRIMVRFADTGPGVPLEVRERLFEPFFTTKREGHGLGLAICQRVLDEQGGEIDFLCPPEGGTTFRVWLRLAPPEETI